MFMYLLYRMCFNIWIFDCVKAKILKHIRHSRNLLIHSDFNTSLKLILRKVSYTRRSHLDSPHQKGKTL